MAAGQGFKTFTTGEVLTAADTNGYLMQGVLVFADAAARTAAITSPQEGQTSYLKDTDAIQVYSGSAWVTKSGAPSPLTTKGDLYTYSTTDARLGVGTNDQVLMADSTTATGLKWATNATVVEPQINLKNTGSYIVSPRLQAQANITATVQTTYYAPVYLTGYALDRIGCRTGSVHSGTSTVRLGIYNHDSTTGKPSTVYLDAGTVSCTASSTDYLITISSTPPAGLYWLAFNAQTATGAASFTGTAAGNNALSSQVTLTMSTLSKYSYWEEASISGAFATAGTLSATTNGPVAGLRIA